MSPENNFYKKKHKLYYITATVATILAYPFGFYASVGKVLLLGFMNYVPKYKICQHPIGSLWSHITWTYVHYSMLLPDALGKVLL